MKRKGGYDPSEPRRMQEAGVRFFTLPGRLRPTAVDRLLRRTVRLINSSGWAWTAECCQGHPDWDGRKRRGDRGWSKHWCGCGGDASPFIVVAVRKERVHVLMWALMEALHSLHERCPDPGHKDHFSGKTPPLEIAVKYPTKKEGYAWRQFVVRFPAIDVKERDEGCATFEVFARNVHTVGKEWGVAKR